LLFPFCFLQQVDYGGWPELHELPLKEMTQEHKDALVAKCSRKKDIAMPNFDGTTTASPCHGKLRVDGAATSSTNTVTPPPNGVFTQQAAAALLPNNDKDSNQMGVTPSPAVGLKPTKAANAKPSTQALALHRKWQEAAEAMGGPDARIVVSKPAAKKLIFDLLHDSFCPMNITQIHKV
jgi:hypothetical protein